MQDDVAPGVVIKQAKAEAAQIDATRPTDPTLEQTRGLLRSMFTAYAHAIYAKTHRRQRGRADADGVHARERRARPARRRAD